MKNRRFSKYLLDRSTGKNEPMKKRTDVRDSHDKKTNQDFEGFPGGQAQENIINPKTTTDKKTAALNVKDGEKKLDSKRTKQTDISEQDSDGSGGAFGGTEEVKE
jgi:hypothetical protein